MMGSCAILFILTNDLADECIVSLCELCDISIKSRFTKKTAYDNLPKITNSLLLINFDNTPVTIKINF